MSQYLIFQLHGPMASWGVDAPGEVRHTHELPSRSALLGLLLAVFLVIASQPGINQVLYAGGHNPLQVLHSHLAANTELLAALGIGGIYLLLPESRKT